MYLYAALKPAVIAGLLLAGGVASPALADDDNNKIPLKLFGIDDISEGLNDCRFSLWQHNRDPETDRYAFLLSANIGGDGLTEKARMKIGSDFQFLYEQVQGGQPIEGFPSQHLYVNEAKTVRVHIDVQRAAFRNGMFYEIEEADFTVIQDGRVPFTANAKGLHGCTSGSNAADVADSSDPVPKSGSNARSGTGHLPAGIPFEEPRYLNNKSEIPSALVQIVRQYAEECDIDGPSAWAGARYVINDYYLLWEMPCFSGAYQASSVFGVTQNPPQGWGEVLYLPNPPHLEGYNRYGMMNAKAIPGRGLITATEFGRGAGDCGSYEAFRLIDGPGEVLELELLEFRDKPDCDGQAVEPHDWHLGYRNY